MKPIPKKTFLVATLAGGISWILAGQAAAQTFKLIYTLPPLATGLANSEGYSIYSGVVVSNDTIYGTAFSGGPTSNGTVFAISTGGTDFNLLHAFSGYDNGAGGAINSDGAAPMAALILSGSTLYGTTTVGGTGGGGTVFSVSSKGTDFSDLYNFTNGTDGGNPIGGLVLSDGILYGTASAAGSEGGGTIFAVGADGTGFQTLYTFMNGADGGVPLSGLVLADGVLYGTASESGVGSEGTVFSVEVSGKNFTTLHGFSALDNNGINSDGSGPVSGLVLSGNTLYGTTLAGGSAGFGTIFSINTDGSNFKTIFTFPTIKPLGENKDGADPYGGLALVGNTLYGTACNGGDYIGAVFSLDTDGSNFKAIELLPNNQSDGSNPAGNLFVSGGTVYGTTRLGGGKELIGGGTIFSVGAGASGPPPKIKTFAIVATASPAHSGLVTGSGIYQSGSSVTLIAAATNDCYQFAKWTVGGKTVSTNAAYIFTPTASEAVVADFSQLEYTIVTSSSPPQGGTTSGGGTKGCGDLVTVKATPKPGFKFEHWTVFNPPEQISSTATYTFYATVDRTLTADFVDIQAPTVTVTSPAPNSKTTSAQVTMKGKAADNLAVAGVYISLNGAPAVQAEPGAANWSTWSATLTLLPGVNTIGVYATDTSGNSSKTIDVKVTYNP